MHDQSPVLKQVLEHVVWRLFVAERLPGLRDVGKDLVGQPVPLAQGHGQAEILQVLLG